MTSLVYTTRITLKTDTTTQIRTEMYSINKTTLLGAFAEEES